MPDSNHNVSAHDSVCCMPKRNTAHANGYFQTQPPESVAQFQARMTNMQNQCAPFQASDVKKLQESQSIPYSWSGGHTFARTQNISQKYASKYPPAKSKTKASPENITAEDTEFIVEGLVKASGRKPENILNKIYKYRIDTYSDHSKRYTRENAISLDMLYYEGE